MSCTPETKNEHRYSASLAGKIEVKWQRAWDASEINHTGNPSDKDFDTSKPNVKSILTDKIPPMFIITSIGRFIQ